MLCSCHAVGTAVGREEDGKYCGTSVVAVADAAAQDLVAPAAKVISTAFDLATPQSGLFSDGRQSFVQPNSTLESVAYGSRPQRKPSKAKYYEAPVPERLLATGAQPVLVTVMLTSQLMLQSRREGLNQI